MNNLDIRSEISKAGIRYWAVADRLGVNDGNFSRLLRRELPPDIKQKILDIISDLKREKSK